MNNIIETVRKWNKSDDPMHEELYLAFRSATKGPAPSSDKEVILNGIAELAIYAAYNQCLYEAGVFVDFYDEMASKE